MNAPRPLAQLCDTCERWRVESDSPCLECGSRSFTAMPLAASGVVYATTVVRIPLPGHEAPVSLAYVDVEPGARALGPLHGTAAVGDTVVVVSSSESATGVAFQQVIA